MRVTFAIGLLGLASGALASAPPPPAGSSHSSASSSSSSSHSSSVTTTHSSSSSSSHSSSVTSTHSSSTSATKTATSSSSASASCTDTATYQCLKGVPFPHMINATLDELSAGLAASELFLVSDDIQAKANSVQSCSPLLIWSTLTKSVSLKFRIT